MFKIVTLISFTIGLNASAFASIDLGMGPISGDSGRPINGVGVAMNTSGYSVGFHGSGLQTSLYYDSSYYVTFVLPSVSSVFWWGAIRGGFGVGAYFTERGYRETTSSDIQRASDFALGPSLRLVWDVLGPVYVSIEGMYGLRDPLNHLFLSFQDVELVVVGFHL